MKRIFRHYSTWLLLIGIMVSFFAFLNGADVYQRVKEAAAEVNDYRYKESYYVSVLNIKDMDEFIENINILKGNVVVVDNDLYLNDANAYHMVEIMIKQDEDFVFPVEYTNYDGGVIIGEAIRQYSYSKDGDNAQYIRIEGKEYVVSGYVNSRYSNLLNGKIIFTTNNMQDSSLLSNMDMINFKYESNNYDANQYFNEFYDKLYEKYSIIYEKDTREYIEVTSKNAEEQYYSLITVFAMINCVVISEFWIMRRKNEIIIRKLWGYTNFRLFIMVYKELMCVSFVAVMTVMVLQCLLRRFSDGIYGEVSMQRLFVSVMFIVISAVIIVLVPIYKAAHYNINEGLES